MLAQLTAALSLPKTLTASHVLVLLPKDKELPRDMAYREVVAAVLKRRGMKADALVKSPVSANAASGALVAWAMLDFSKSSFSVQTQVRKALQLLLGEQPASITIVVHGDASQRQQAAESAVYSAWVNGTPLPLHKKKADQPKPLQKIALYGIDMKAVQFLPPERGKARSGRTK